MGRRKTVLRSIASTILISTLLLTGIGTTVGVDLVLVITLLAVGRLGIAVTTDRELAVLGAAVLVTVVTVITLLTLVENAITASGSGTPRSKRSSWMCP